MLVARNIESLLQQAARPSRTTDSRTLAVTITQPSGSSLCTVTNGDFSITKISMYALLATREGITDHFKVYGIDGDEKVYGSLVPGSEYGVVIVTERDFPDGLVKIRMRKLTEELKELAKFDDEMY